MSDSPVKALRKLSLHAAAFAFGAVTLASQTLILRRFLWRIESTETGVSIFLTCWLLWSGIGAALAATPPGRRLVAWFARWEWLPPLLCAALYFAHYALIGDLRAWLGAAEYQSLPLLRLTLGCLLANAPFCILIGWGVPLLSRAFERQGLPVSRTFAMEALGAALCGLGLTAMLVSGHSPDPRDAAEWQRYFPRATSKPGRFETGGGTTLYGWHGGTFYALTSGGVSEMLPEDQRAVEQAVLALSQRPYAASALLLGEMPLATAMALERFRPDLSITWCPGDAQYGLELLAALARGGLSTKVKGAGDTPQAFLRNQPAASFDLIMVMPPPATSLGGAAWRTSDFARSVRRITRRTGVAIFGLALEGDALTPEKTALLENTVRPLRAAWQEAGLLAAGAGGWWIAAQVTGLAYDGQAATERFAMLKQEARFPSAAIPLLYDAPRAHTLANQCAALATTPETMLPLEKAPEDILASGFAAMLRRDYPTTAPGAWLARLRTAQAPRLTGLALLLCWIAPVALGRAKNANCRMRAAWLAAIGALGLVTSLTILYLLEIRFGSLYLLAGAASSLYLGGLFLGNVAGARLVKGGTLLQRASLVALPFAQATLALLLLKYAAQMESSLLLTTLCLAAGAIAGTCVPLALAASREQAGDAPMYVLADALGAAAAGATLVFLLPLAGLHGIVLCFSALALGLGLCAACGERHARLCASLSLAVTLVLLGRHLPRDWLKGLSVSAPSARTVARPTPPRSTAVTDLPGVPRRIDRQLIDRQIREGALATNEAAFYQ